MPKANKSSTWIMRAHNEVLLSKLSNHFSSHNILGMQEAFITIFLNNCSTDLNNIFFFRNHLPQLHLQQQVRPPPQTALEKQQKRWNTMKLHHRKRPCCWWMSREKVILIRVCSSKVVSPVCILDYVRT